MKMWKKSQVGDTMFLVILLLSILLVYFQVNRVVRYNIHEELNQVTSITLGSLRSSVDLSIKNYLRSAVETNKSLVSMQYEKYQLGLLTEREAKRQAEELLLSQKIGDTGYFYVISSEGVILVHPKSIVGEKLDDQFSFAKQQTQLKKGYLEYMWANPDDTIERPKALYMDYFEPWDWILSASSYREEFVRLIDPEDFRAEIENTTIGETGYVVLLDAAGKALIHPSLDSGVDLMEIKDARGELIFQIILEEKNGSVNYWWVNPGEAKPSEKLARFGYYPELNWFVMSTAYISELERGKRNIYLYILLQFVVIVFLILNFRRKRVFETKLRTSEEKYRNVTENSPAAVFQFKYRADGSPVFTYISEAVESITGFKSEDVLNEARVLLDNVYTGDQEAFNKNLMVSLSQVSNFHLVHRFCKSDGSIIWVEVRATAQRHSNKEIVMDGFFLDVSERKNAEKSLKEANDKLNALFSSMTEMVVLHDLVFDEKGEVVNYRITDCNAAYTNITGITHEMAVGKLATELYGTPEPPYLKEFSSVALSGDPYIYETYFAPMEKHFAISVVSPGKNKFATITTDITMMKKFQQTIEAKNKELEQIVYVASHDLRSPLVNVEGYSQELEFSLSDLTKVLNNPEATQQDIKQVAVEVLPDIMEAINHIKVSTHDMDSLLKGLLKLSRTGRASLNIETIDMNYLMDRILVTLEFQIRQLEAQVIVTDLPPCKGDMVQLTQVFSNLIGNALKYHDPSRKSVVKISGKVEFDRSIYCVEDNGVGIAPEHQEIIYELFHRLNPSQKDGEGLGLTIVRQILSRLDGEIRLESEPGVGSKFFVLLNHAPLKK
jgi:PAS domain S-box-containing protein